MFGRKSQPARIYSYGANAPITNEELVIEQMRKGFIYRNKLVDLELERRKKVDDALKSLAPSLEELDNKIAAVEVAVEALFAEMRRENSRARKRGSAPGEVKASLAELKKERAKLFKSRKELRSATFKSEEWKSQSKSIDEWAQNEQRARRAEAAKGGLYWGTYLAIEQSTSDLRTGAPPSKRFGWDGTGRVVVQIQGGIPVHDLMRGGKEKKGRIVPDARLQLESHPDGVWVRGSRRPSPNSGVRVDGDGIAMRKLGTAIAKVRVGSNGRAPIWADVPFVLHRPLPDDGSIKWVYLKRERVGVDFRWSMMFVVSKPTEEAWMKPDAASSGVVAIDIGWRLMDDTEHPGAKQIRAAVWTASDGQSGEIRLPGKFGMVRSTKWEWESSEKDEVGRSWIPWHEGYKKTEELQGLRDDRFNEARSALVSWLRATGVPAWIREFVTKRDSDQILSDAEVIARIEKWRAIKRLVFLVIKWHDNRAPGDDAVFASLSYWRARDKHFLCWLAHQRDQLQAQRFDAYRCAAAFLRRRYSTFVIEARSKKEENPSRPMDLRQFHELPPPDAKPGAVGEKGSQAKEYVRDACLSSLRQCLDEAASELATIPAPGTTFVCSACGSEEKQMDKKVLFHTCSVCSARWDQDMNAARNLLSRYTAGELSHKT